MKAHASFIVMIAILKSLEFHCLLGLLSRQQSDNNVSKQQGFEVLI